MFSSIKYYVKLGLFSLILLILLAFSILYLPNTKFLNDSQSIFIPSGTSMEKLMDILSTHINSQFTFSIVAKVKRFDTPRGGHFLLKKKMGNQQIINTLRSKNTPVKVTFNNQQTIEHLVGRIAEQLEIDSISLINEITSDKFMDSVNLSRDELLSLFIPNTYEIYWNVSASDFCKRMKIENEQFWNEEREYKRKQINLKRSEVMSLAAIVNGETKQNLEMPIIAGVYLNRLRKGMKLQSCPTIIYSMKRNSNDFNLVVQRLFYKDLEIQSPYNTYANYGLTPGPISMPSISAIEAVLNPTEHKFIFFTADSSRPGFNTFSETYSSHLNNRDNYIKWLNDNRIMR